MFCEKGKNVHNFLKSVGFSEFKRKKEVNTLIQEVVQSPDYKAVFENEEGTIFAEFRKDYGENIGIAVRGEYIEEDVFDADYFYPYFCGSEISTHEKVEIEKYAAIDSYAGICDEMKVGVTLIFYLQNAIEHLKITKNIQSNITSRKNIKINTTLTLSALSNSGRILLPMKKVSKEAELERLAERKRLLTAAREGDEQAIEKLTFEDMDIDEIISRRIVREDILTIVSSYVMPYGIESDQYSILGEIQDVNLIENFLTHEKLYLLKLNCNELVFELCINAKNLLGEPAVGRRFKGIIWMQGNINYEY